MITVKLTDYTTDDVSINSNIPTEFGNNSALNQEIEINYDGGRLNVYCGSTLVFSTLNAGIDFNLVLQPC